MLYPEFLPFPSGQPMRSDHDRLKTNTIVTATTYEEDDVSSIGSLSEDEDAFYLCLPQSQPSTKSLSCRGDCRTSLSSMGVRSNHLQSLPQSTISNKNDSPSKFSGEIYHTSTFRLSRKSLPKKSTEDILVLSNQLEVPRSTRKRNYDSR